MSTILHHECTRVPVTALASCGALLVAAEGPFVRLYHNKNSCYISSQRVFKAQAVHGVSVCSEEPDHVIRLIIWGGRLCRVLEISFASSDIEHMVPRLYMSDVARAPDWILDMAPRPANLKNLSERGTDTCVAITAHNALLQLSIERQTEGEVSHKSLSLTILELTSSFRSILYSAHLLWDSVDQILIAAGTAFGEIMYWSWNRGADTEPVSCIHRIFLGHEGSIFGVQISKELEPGCDQKLKRIIASCSDDRTIRIWDVSDVNPNLTTEGFTEEGSESQRTRHTGLSNEHADTESAASSNCLAIGWGHTSRVWMLRFPESSPSDKTICLLSAGEDATTRSWILVPNDGKVSVWPYKLLELDSAAYHSGKNIWAATMSSQSSALQRVVRGAADSKITSHPLVRSSQNTPGGMGISVNQYTVLDVLSMAQSQAPNHSQEADFNTHTSSKKADIFRSYCFLDDDSVLLTTNSGKVFLEKLESDPPLREQRLITNSTFIDQLEDLSEHSVCSSATSLGITFVAGSRGSIYSFSKNDLVLKKLHAANGKVAEMFVTDISCSSYRRVALLITLAGPKESQLLYMDLIPTHGPEILRIVTIPMTGLVNDSTTASMSHIEAAGGTYVCLGFRRGSVAVYAIPEDPPEASSIASPFKVIEKLHGNDTVTALTWVGSVRNSSQGHLFSVGRDGSLAVSSFDFTLQSINLVHNLALPIGPKIEGLYFHQDHLLVHGFSSKQWVLYDVTAEEEIMSIETGGAHRSWAFQPSLSAELGGTLVWTRASSMHICSQTRPTHDVIRSGGHGREIKAVAVSSPKGSGEALCHLIATGAEDTDIKIFQYIGGDLICRRTLRRHTTGIQHLQWSEDGEYLFSGGGREEFYIWRFRKLPSFMDIGVVCEFVYAPESEHSDLRIMSFDVTRRNAGYDVAMVFSDSNIKVYHYDPTSATKWQSIAQGIYFTSCLTQSMFLSPRSILTAGTDGHVAVWPLSLEANRSSAVTPVLTPSWPSSARIHQSSSKTMISHTLNDGSILVVSGGDDGGLAFLRVQSDPSSPDISYTSPPVLVCRAHASAVTACAILGHESRVFVLTSGNDEWVRVWEVCQRPVETDRSYGTEDQLSIKRLMKVKTNVADVSSMAVLPTGAGSLDARVLICGVGMEVIRVEWDM
ncbi:WD repeat protein-like protein [Dothidotthia symphoricarpi CBS 119687]|uniref:WD repeat protein-like protein n=1 Tax=Dothidotthia symphoricarpi CBS 119687 TaxID=1392245 RepID=A0A6A6AJ31_9PLEO|nr:WD repeat protein-like protein [Dothidotthia symphoricarpi CBS 119687]KAF2131949.1 WD repeat protein-like protein [Dothidotthia symphoricarpi CBS 119687]